MQMVALEPAAQPVNVGPAQNNTYDIAVPDNYAQYRIDRVECIPLSGSASKSAVTLSSDPAFASRRKQVAAWQNVTLVAPLDDQGPSGAGFVWDSADGKTLRVKIVPDAGNDNAYDLRVHIGRTV